MQSKPETAGSAATDTTAPWPLVQSLGAARDIRFYLSMEMMGALNAVERSESHFENLFAHAGLRLTKAYHCRSLLAVLEVQIA